jgi:hypothetical protein
LENVIWSQLRRLLVFVVARIVFPLIAEWQSSAGAWTNHSKTLHRISFPEAASETFASGVQGCVPLLSGPN